MPDVIAERILMDWLLRCDALRPLDFDAAERIQSRIVDMRLALQTSQTGFLPIGEDKFKAEHSDWFDRVTGKKQPMMTGGRGGN